MAYEIPVLVISLRAAEDLSAKQFYHVKLDASGDVVVPTALTDVPAGILLNKPTSGQTAEVGVLGIFKVNSDAALSIGDFIGPAADGQADARTIGTDTTHYVSGRVLEASGAAGGYATAMINCLAPHRAS